MSSPPPSTDGFTVAFENITTDDLPRVGGKGANLGALTRAGIPVPPGYCVTTKAFDEFVGALPEADRRFAELERLDGTDVATARRAAAAMREALGSVPIPPRSRAAGPGWKGRVIRRAGGRAGTADGSGPLATRLR